MRVAVIGAGAAGLAAAKALAEVGLRPTVFEESDEIGGLWVYREHGLGPAYRSLRTNTSKQITAFSDVPFPADAPDFPARAEVEAYLRRYAQTFGLMPMIRFRRRVEFLRPGERDGWLVKVDRGAEEAFDAVAVCTGIFRKPSVPSTPGFSTFAGRTLHSLDYRVPEPFAGQHVLVVGIGSSAADIAADLVGTAGRVTLSVRRGAWVAPRFVAGRPLDHYATRLAMMLPASARAGRRIQLVLGEYTRRGVEPPTGVWARANVPFDMVNAPNVGSDALLPHIRSGEIEVYPAIKQIGGSKVIFADGRELCPDGIIFGTGYGLDFPFLPPELQPWKDAVSGLFRLVFDPERPTLPFIGVCRVHGPILPIVEMQARWAAQVLCGRAHLPSSAETRAEIQQRSQRQLAAGGSPIRVSLLPYLDELAAEIGARPRLWRHPALLPALMTGPPVAAQYRLDGPGTWPGACRVILEARR
jgi:dimethylaniline monooxygenase (N-oxide forming)